MSEDQKSEKEIIDSIQFVVFSDNVGRNLIGELVGQTDSQIEVKNPVVVVEQVNPQNQQRSLGYAEAFYPQLLKEGSETVWHFNINNITIIASELSDEAKKLYAYVIRKIDAPQAAPAPAPQGNEGKVVNLFDA